MLIEWVSITCIRKKYNTCEISRVCNNRCSWLCLTYFDSKFGDGFNRNFFDRDWQYYSKNWIFRIIEIRKIGNIFTLNHRKKDRDWQSDSKNPVVSKKAFESPRFDCITVLEGLILWSLCGARQLCQLSYFGNSLFLQFRIKLKDRSWKW